MRVAILTVALLFVFGCTKSNISTGCSRAIGNWAEITPPSNCKPVQIAAEEGSGLAVLCADGRLFH